jgi:ankyrin repeat protein
MVKMDDDVKKLLADMRALAILKTKNARDARRAEIYRLIELLPVETQNKSGETLLVKAADSGDEDLVRHLMNKGANIEGDHRLTPLMAASSKGHVEIMNILLDAGANLHASNGSVNALYYAVREGTVEAARLLLAKGLTTCTKNDSLKPPLHLAASRGSGDPSMLSLIIEHGADASGVDEHGKTALHHAARSGNAQSAVFLLGRGASATLADNAGLTALHVAAGRCDRFEVAMMTALLAHGAPVDAVDGQGRTPLHHSADAYRADLSDTARVLLQAGADANAIDAKGDTALHLLARNYHTVTPLELAQLLIDHGADVAAHNNANQRPSDVAWNGSNRTFLLAAEEAQKNNHRYKRPRLEDLQPPAAAAAVQEQEQEEEVDESEDDSEDEDEDEDD